jgi:ribosomal protein S18 acetylase RimI-like enzyme
MAVAKVCRGAGVGNALITRALIKSESLGLKRIELSVNTANLPAQALYKKHGFGVEGTRKNGWCLRGEYMDVFTMARVLP